MVDSVGDGIGTERGATGALFERFSRGGKSPGSEGQRQVVSGLLAEIAGDLATILNLALDGRGGSHKVIQNDGHLAANILLREGAEAPRGFGRQSEINLPHAGIRRAAVLDGSAQVAAGDDSRTAQHIPSFAGVASTGGIAHVRAARLIVRGGRER